MPFSGERLSRHVYRDITLVFLMLAGVALSGFGQRGGQQAKQKRHPGKKAQAEAVAAPQPAPPPPPPPTPEQMPSRPPSVTYQNGQLSIVAPNSTLKDILQAVKSKTGAAIDIPAGANERVVSRFGPGPPRDVIAALLNGSHFNYVMIGSDGSPDSVAQVILTPRIGGAEAGPANPGQGTQQNQPAYSGQVFQPHPFPPQGVPNNPQPDAQGPQPGAESEEEQDAAEQDNGNAVDEGAPEQVTQEGQDNGQPQVKTPEQLLQELQRQQQMQQQQQQQQVPQGQEPQSQPQPVQPPGQVPPQPQPQ